MSQAYHYFDVFAADLGLGKHTFGTNQLNVALSNTLPVHGNAVFTDIVDLTTTGTGYTAGGLVCTGVTFTQTLGVATLNLTIPVLTATGVVGPFAYAVLYNTVGTKPLIGWWNLPSAVTMANTDTETLTLPSGGFVITGGSG